MYEWDVMGGRDDIGGWGKLGGWVEMDGWGEMGGLSEMGVEGVCVKCVVGKKWMAEVKRLTQKNGWLA